MKKNLKKALSTALASTLAIAGLGIMPAANVQAAGENYDGEFDCYIAFGCNEDWGVYYYNPGNSAGVTQEPVTAKVGDTVTLTATLDAAAEHTWFLAPVLVAEGIGELDYDITLSVDGAETAIDFSAGDAWWYEATGDYTDTQSIRLAGGYNEWAAQYIEQPLFTEISYTITINSASKADEAPAATADYDGDFESYLAFGCNEDWGVFYYNPGNSAGVTQEPVTAKVGDTYTLTATLDETCGYTWFLSPVIVAEGVAEMEYDIALSIDGVETDMDLTAGDAWWYEATGDYADTQAIRLAGGYNEWGTQYISSPVFKEITYTVTVKSMKVGSAEEAAVEEPVSAAGEVDLNGTYNAYIGIQSPTYSFRNAWYDSYGKAEPEFFNQITGWEGSDAVTRAGVIHDTEIAGNGTYTVSITDMDLTGDFDSQDYFNLIFVSTDIPNTEAITISDMKLSVDGRNVEINPIVSPDSVDYLTMLIQNVWNDDVKTIGYYAVPPKNVEITFTVSGFAYDAAVEEAPVETTAAPTEAPVVEVEEPAQSNTGLIVGIVVVVVAVAAGAFVVISKKKKQ